MFIYIVMLVSQSSHIGIFTEYSVVVFGYDYGRKHLTLLRNLPESNVVVVVAEECSHRGSCIESPGCR
jgi:hypothetical protein